MTQRPSSYRLDVCPSVCSLLFAWQPRLQGQFSILEFVTKGASKLVGDYRPWKIVKELKKLKQKDTVALEATNAALSSQVADLKMALVKKDEEIRQLKEQKKESLDRISKVIGNLDDLVNKAHMFDNYIKTEMPLLLPKVITISVSFGRKMEAILVEMRKLVSRLPAESSRSPLPSLAATSQKEKPVVELKTPLP